MSKSTEYIDISSDKKSNKIDTIFKSWDEGNERVCIFSPHDDDAILGAGYLINASLKNNAEVFIYIFCSGNAGYSRIDQKDEIVEIRKNETVNAYNELDIAKENIIRFDYPDFSMLQYMGWKIDDEREGCFKKVVTTLREQKITRVVIPNNYREHSDHSAVGVIGLFDSQQASDPVVVDWAAPSRVKSILQYSVWGDFCPEDMLVERRKADLRANRIVLVNEEVEKKVRKAISKYRSQGEIINGLVIPRDEKKSPNGKYIELFVELDPRPKLEYAPYIEYIETLNTKEYKKKG